MKKPRIIISLITFLVLALITSLACEVQADKPEPPVITNPVVNEFSASSLNIVSGETVTFSWNTSNADTVVISPEIGSVEASGSIAWKPVQSTTYTITATNTVGTDTRLVRISIVEEKPESGCVFIGCDPVSGRNQSILLELEQLCLATQYQVEIAKDAQFSLMVYDSGPYSPYSTTSPAFIYPAGGVFECGHTYYVRFRVRNTATGQAIISPWSPTECYTIGAGFPVSKPTYTDD